jgi:hypothetical protein
MDAIDGIDDSSRDDELDTWFINALADELGSASEVAPGVIRVVDEEPTAGRDRRRSSSPASSRDRWRGRSSTSSDDRSPDAIPAVLNPLHAGARTRSPLTPRSCSRLSARAGAQRSAGRGGTFTS